MKLSQAAKLLYYSGIDSARYDATILFEKIGGYKRQDLYLDDPDCKDPELIRAVDRRSQREPLQYIVGEVGFYRETYKVTPDCLIPRSDTEILVDYAVKNIPAGESFIDLCTGSGCIAISVLKNTHSTSSVAVDISEGALAVASENSKINGTEDRLTLLCHDVLSKAVEGEFFAVLSNPPYIRAEVYEALAPEIFHEPKIALVGGDDGLEFYKFITKHYKSRIKPEGFILFEIGYDQGEAIKTIAEDEKMAAEILKDLSGNDRVAVLRRQASK